MVERNHSRRSVLSGITAAGVAAATAATATPVAATPANEADRLYRVYVGMIPERRRLDAEFDAAEAAIPEWARPGPRYLMQDGTFTGTVVGWPMRTDIRLPEGPARINCRPSPHDIRGDYVALSRWLKGEQAVAARRGYRKRLRAFVTLQRAQKAEEARAGLDEKGIACDRHVDRMYDVMDRLLKLSPSMNSLAAMAFIDAKLKPAHGYARGEMQDFHFEHARPALTGLIAEHADLLLHCEAFGPKLSKMPFYG